MVFDRILMTGQNKLMIKDLLPWFKIGLVETRCG
jgi:hypothetical protein